MCASWLMFEENVTLFYTPTRDVFI